VNDTPTDPAGEADPEVLLRSMEPRLDGAEYVVVTFPAGGQVDLSAGSPTALLSGLAPVAVVTEAEGTTWVIGAELLAHAIAAGLDAPLGADGPSMARITLTVHSSLVAVGLTAAVSSALAARGISCNVVTGYFHDQLFVPAGRGPEALRILQDLAARSAT